MVRRDRTGWDCRLSLVSEQSGSGMTHDDVLALLAEARLLVQSERYDDATACYRLLFVWPDIAAYPVIHCEVLSNLGALLLHLADSDGNPAYIDEAVELLGRARSVRSPEESAATSAIADINLALAYIKRAQNGGPAVDLMLAHMVLDGAEAMLRKAGDVPTLDWLNSVRDLLTELFERRRSGR